MAAFSEFDAPEFLHALHFAAPSRGHTGEG